MEIPKAKLVERRRYIRLAIPLKISCILPDIQKVFCATTKNISADGLRFEAVAIEAEKPAVVQINIELPESRGIVHVKGRIVWKSKRSLEDKAPYDIGVEFTEIENDNKNTFLKFLCDLIYSIDKEGFDE